MELKTLKFDKLFVGMRVFNDVKEEGTIVECTDIHNIRIQLDNGGFDLQCLSETCERKEGPLYQL